LDEPGSDEAPGRLGGVGVPLLPALLTASDALEPPLPLLLVPATVMVATGSGIVSLDGSGEAGPRAGPCTLPPPLKDGGLGGDGLPPLPGEATRVADRLELPLPLLLVPAMLSEPSSGSGTVSLEGSGEAGPAAGPRSATVTLPLPLGVTDADGRPGSVEALDGGDGSDGRSEESGAEGRVGAEALGTDDADGAEGRLADGSEAAEAAWKPLPTTPAKHTRASLFIGESSGTTGG
jgi:hypothetical protein